MNSIEIFTKILEIAQKEKYPDVHISSGSFPLIRNRSGDLEPVESIVIEEQSYQTYVLSFDDVENIIKHILSDDKYGEYVENFEVDSSYSIGKNERYRVNCYTNIHGKAIALRQIPHEIPSIQTLGLTEGIRAMCDRSKGLVLMTGPTGSGKSTNLAAMIDYINTNYQKHIISIEDPVEFMFHGKKSLIHQREVGIHTKGFAQAMKSCLREDPDVIMVGEMRDPETIRAALTLAETGHLVFSTLHTNDTVQTIDRIIDVFPDGQQEQIRMQLAMSLVGVVAQRLVPRSDKEGRIPVREIMINNDAVKNLIITGTTHQLYSIIEIGQKQGMILMDNYLIALYKKGFISKETLLSYSRDKENIENLINM